MSLSDIQKKLTPVFRAHRLKKAAVFGSFARGEEKAGSDVDILVTLGTPMGLISYNRFVNEVEKELGRRADVVTERGLNKFIRPYILKDLHTIYEE